MTVNPRTSSSTASWFAIVGCAIILAGFFAYMPGYGPER
jgi:LPXTG-motif cell wall-anchored protein